MKFMLTRLLLHSRCGGAIQQAGQLVLTLD
jgi:hypothetical protein